MSMRPVPMAANTTTNQNTDMQKFGFKLDATATNSGANSASSPALEWKDLSETEKSAASLGVSPDAWKPISFMNQAHYDTLLRANAIDGDLAKKLESYKHVATAGGE